MSSAHRLIALAAIAALAGCGLVPPSKYDVSSGLVVEAAGTGRSALESGTPAARREARMAAILQGLAAWCESFVEVQRDAASSEDEIPLELYDPEDPPEDISNLAPYDEDVADAAIRLALRVQPTGRADVAGNSSTARRRGYVATCSLRPGVDYRYEAAFDEFEIQILDEATLSIGADSDYFQPMELVVVGGTLGQTEGDVIVPLEYIEGLLDGHRIKVNVQELPDGAARATLVRRFPPQ